MNERFVAAGLCLLLTACSSSSSEQPINELQAAASDDAPPGETPDSVVPDAQPSTGPPGNPGLVTASVLLPLPTPPASPAPEANDEPQRVSSPTNTVSEFFVVRDRGATPVDTADKLSDNDFDAGPLPARSYWPPTLDIGDNQPPDFENLEDQIVNAGDTLELLLKPIDPDGGLPGMFPGTLPPGARLDDNRNGTKSLVWRPLQPDVGIIEFTITAVDPVEPGLRTERIVRIKTVLPADTSGIENFSPAVNLVRPHTVRVNDPVVVEIKGSDPNGTIPVLTLDNPPPGASFVQHYRETAVRVLKFTPRATGTLTLQVTATDAEDPELSASREIIIDVRDDADFIREGSRLRELASARDMLFGFAALNEFYHRADGALYADIGAEEFNIVTTENSLKWDLVNPLPGRFQWASTDNLVNYARSGRMAVHGHTLIWHRQLPGWIKRSAPESRELHMREYIDRVLNRYRDSIPIWDVVNEALEEDGNLRESVWSEAMGVNFIDKAFRQARQSAPEATLLYNDYDIAWNGPKSDGLFKLLQTMKDNETPIDGVGFQLHVFASFDQEAEVAANFQRVADMDLDIYITELDVSMAEGNSLAQQAAVYERILSVCLEQARCKAVQTWGYTDMYSWRREFTPLLLDEAYQVKPAYQAIQQRLSEN